MDDTLRVAVEDAREAVRRQRAEEAKDGQGLSSKLPELEERLREAEAAADEAVVSFTFRAVGRKQLDDLVRECPPSPEQLERWRETTRTSPLLAGGAPEYDPSTFYPRLIAASLVEPEATSDEVLAEW